MVNQDKQKEIDAISESLGKLSQEEQAMIALSCLVALAPKIRLMIHRHIRQVEGRENTPFLLNKH